MGDPHWDGRADASKRAGGPHCRAPSCPQDPGGAQKILQASLVEGQPCVLRALSSPFPVHSAPKISPLPCPYLVPASAFCFHLSFCLDRWFSKCGPLTSNIGISGELVKMQTSQILPQPCCIRNWGRGSVTCVFKKAFW